MFLRAISLFALATLASNPNLYAVDLVLLDNTATGSAAIANVASRALISTVSQSAVTFTNQNAVAAELTSITFPVEPFQAVNDVTIKVELWTVSLASRVLSCPECRNQPNSHFLPEARAM